MDILQVIDRYEQRREERGRRLGRFLRNEEQGFLIVQHPVGKVWGTCNSVEEVYVNNIEYVWAALQVDWTDDLPYLTPWVGTGVYANAFGCRYVFRSDNAPHVHYLHRHIEEIRGIEYPDYRESPIMTMVLDCIDCFNEQTHGRLPIALTDTQSAFDTATLIVDACEVFAACYEDEQLLVGFLQKINDLIIEFSRVQIARIGPELVARPGHQMPSLPGGPGISVSDDNLAVASPLVNRKIALPADRQLADAFGGLALHSCGNWTHTMPMLRELPNMMLVECAVGRSSGDPKPNEPGEVRRALAGSPIIAKARVGDDIQNTLSVLDKLADSELNLIVEIGYDEQNAERNYRLVREKLEKIYHG